MNTNPKTRCAVSLAELLVVMSACTIILSMSAMLIHRAMHTHSTTRDFLDDERSALRLSDQFRRDVHQATDATTLAGNRDSPLDAEELLRLSLADGVSIAYSHATGLVTRVLKQGDSLVSREEYSFPQHIAISVHEEAAPRRLVLSITAKPASPDVTGDAPPTRPAVTTPFGLHIAACLGRDTHQSVAAAPQERPQ